MADLTTLAGIEAELADTADYDVTLDVAQGKGRKKTPETVLIEVPIAEVPPATWGLHGDSRKGAIVGCLLGRAGIDIVRVDCVVPGNWVKGSRLSGCRPSFWRIGERARCFAG